MNINLQKTTPGGGNSGTCRVLVEYCEHETREKITLQKEDMIIPFYDKIGQPVSAETAVKTIDGNRKHLHADDSKFYHLVISPSEDEIKCLGETRVQRLASLHELTAEYMDIYARQFNRETIKGRKDLVYFYTIHEYRKDEKDENLLIPGIHVHVIISRNDASGKIKLSPRTNHKQGGTSQTAVIKNGFNRTDYYLKCEKSFDSKFGYIRPVEQSFEYCNTLKHGPEERRKEMIGKAVAEMGIEEDARASLMESAWYLAREADRAHRKREEEERQRMKAEAWEKRCRRNEFWNTYHSQYKPHLNALCQSCNDTFTLYKESKENYGIISKELDDKYKELKQKYLQLDYLRKDMAKKDTLEDLTSAFILCLLSGNILAILVVVVLCAIMEAGQKSTAIVRQDLKQQVSSIKKDIETLSKEKQKLSLEKTDILKKANQMRNEKKAFINEINRLKAELDRPIPKKDLQILAKQYAEHRRVVSIQTKQQVQDVSLSESITSAFQQARTITWLRRDMEALGCMDFKPVTNNTGEVLDFEYMHDARWQRVSGICSPEQLTTMLLDYQKLSGQRMAANAKKKNNNQISI